MMILSLVAALTLAQGADDKERSYDREARVTYVQEALQALTAADPHSLDNALTYIRAMERNTCLSSFHRLRIECLLQKVRKNCRGKPKARRACRVYSDIMVTNLLGEHSFVDKDHRIILMQTYSNFREALTREVKQRYGKLVADFRLAKLEKCGEDDDMACLSRNVDAYCMEHADTGNLSWQYCSSAIVWFLGTVRPAGS